MKKYLFLAINTLLLICVFSGEATSVHATTYTYDRKYAIGQITGSFKAAQAILKWANPTVHDSSINGFSDETLWVLNNGKWIETGWTKTDPPGSRPMGTYLYYAWSPDGQGLIYYETILEPFQAHYSYRIGNLSENTWNIYINGVLRANINAGFSIANKIQVGGEVSNSPNAMGVSGNLNLSYKDINNNWIAWSTTERIKQSPYEVVYLYNSKNNLQNYGNNP